MACSNPKLEEFWLKAFAPDIRYVTLYGGRMSGKTWSAAEKAIKLACLGKIRFVCTRQIQKRIKDSVYEELKSQIEKLGKEDQFTILANEIINHKTGSEFKFYGIKHSISEIKGLSNIDITWNEEAEGYTKDQHDILAPTLFRKQGAQMWNIFNPHLSTDFIWKNFVVNPPSDSVQMGINYNDNPFLSDTALREISDAKERDIDTFNHIYLGQPNDNDDESIIKRSWVMAAIDAHIKLGIDISGSRRIGFDVADAGKDKCAQIYAHGPLAIWSDLWKAKEDELPKSTKRVYAQAVSREAEIIYDAIGVGASVGGMVNDLNEGKHVRISHTGFFAGGTVYKPDSRYKDTKLTNKDFFSNIKAQAWWDIADRLKNTYQAIRDGVEFRPDEMIFISSDIPNLTQLIDELCTPRKDFAKDGKVIVESKKDLEKRDIDSPNCFIDGTLIATPSGEQPIEKLKKGDFVITPMGISKITHIHKNKAKVIENIGLTGTPSHHVFTWNEGWKQLQMLTSCDKLEPLKNRWSSWQIMNLLFTKERCSQFSIQVNTIAQEGMEGKTLEMSDFYTGAYGSIITGKFLKIATYTISMAIGKIIELKTLNVLILQFIKANICLKDSWMKNIGKKIIKFSILQEKKQLNGINQMKAENGIPNTLKLLHKILLKRNLFAKYAGIYILQQSRIALNAAQKLVQQSGPIETHKLRIPQDVKIAEQNLTIRQQEKEIKLQEDVQKNAHMQLKERDVYNITLDKHNVYYANGILVRNCADAFIMAFVELRRPLNITSETLKRYGG
jgi:phage terminase large subunit